MLWIVAALPIQTALSPAPVPRYVNSETVLISYRTDAEPAAAVPVDVWLSRDGGATWTPTDADAPAAGVLRFVAPDDGRYDLVLAPRRTDGASLAPPMPGTPPTVRVIVDTAPPTLQVHGVEVVATGEARPCLQFFLTLLEEHLSAGALRVYYRRAGAGAWLDGGVLDAADRPIAWEPPADAAGPIDVRLVATDLAGNSAYDEVRSVTMTTVVSSGAERVGPQQPAGSTAVAHTAIGPTPRPATVTRDNGSLASASQPANDADDRDVAASARLRRLAARHAERGETALAIARLEEALALSPPDAELICELGALLLRSRQYQQAQQRFEAVLRISADHVSALDGLALIAVSEGRYTEARTFLARVLAIRPDAAAYWLRYGDNEQRLGNSRDAEAGWRRAAALAGADESLRKKAEERLKSLVGIRP